MTKQQKNTPALPPRYTLEAGLALYTAMYESLEADDGLTTAQIVEAMHDRVLGVLNARLHDYTIYQVRRARIYHYAIDEETSKEIEAHERQRYATLYTKDGSHARLVAENYAQALTPSPAVKRWRRTQERRAQRQAQQLTTRKVA